MAFSHTNSKGKTYFLHARDTTLKSGSTQTIYFFAGEQKEGALDSVPPGTSFPKPRTDFPFSSEHSNPSHFAWACDPDGHCTSHVARTADRSAPERSYVGT